MMEGEEERTPSGEGSQEGEKDSTKEHTPRNFPHTRKREGAVRRD